MRTFRTIFLLGIFTLLAFADSTEIKRPTSDSDPGASTWATNNCGIGTYTANSTAGTLARDAAGQSTGQAFSQSGSLSSTKITSRVFSTWDTTSNTYSALTLNVNSRSQTNFDSVGGKACIAYSVDAGGTWTLIRCANINVGWTQTTDTITLSTSQNLSQLRVGVCMLGQNGGSATDGTLGNGNATLYDIWTSGITSAQGPGTGSGSGNANPPVQFN